MFGHDFQPAPGTFRPGAIGEARCRIKHNYALMPPEGVMPSLLPQWRDTVVRFLAGPVLGAQFGQVMLEIEGSGGTRQPLNDGLQHFYYLFDGALTLSSEATGTVDMTPGSFVFLPAGETHEVRTTDGAPARLMDIRKPYFAVEGIDTPPAIVSHRDQLEKINHNGTIGRTWEHMLPFGDLRYDFEVNILSFEPGANFPEIETHINEHGLVMLEGQGMYLLGSDWHEVWQEDFIWMGAYCPQFFYPTGWTRSAYMLYKNVNRDTVFTHQVR
ncbi:(S)-ureidoglycine aminohydrolase [Celeribacter sp.]|uniref:(S)-ureidoglycine aminohydrolase n=1 Tax=Celeribacter sp. TaxID=1890673 RepID=UPI003A92F0CA